MEESALVQALRELRSAEALTSGPLVSIVVTNRDGATHLQRLLNGLQERTQYQPFEVVLVDNGSTDESIELLQNWNGDSQIIANASNKSFSEANNQGIRVAKGELVLLANNDIDPVHPGWLGFMVETLLDGAAVVGALLVYPKRQRQDKPPAYPDCTIQHSGVAFERSKWGVRARNLGSGEDPLEVVNPRTREVPAVTAACLLARRIDLLTQPLDEKYWYGSEDWDLSLHLGRGGSVVVDERAVLFHHEYGTQAQFMDAAWLEQRQNNHRWFNQLWAPAIRRQLRVKETAATPNRDFQFPSRPSVKVIGVAGNEGLATRLTAEAKTSGWEVDVKESGEANFVIALGPPMDIDKFVSHDLSVALVTGNELNWAKSGALDGSKLIITLDGVSQAKISALWGAGIAQVQESLPPNELNLFDELRRRSSPSPRAMRVGVAHCAPTWEKAQFWGDTYFARGLMRAFRRQGHEATELIKSSWEGPAASSCDVVIHLRGLTRRTVARGQWNLMWIISHPDRIDRDEYNDYDLIACASKSHAARLTEEIGRTVHWMPQATDADMFKIGDPMVDYQIPVLYVGNSRSPHRRAPRWMMRSGRDFHLYGKNWQKFPEARFSRGEFISNDNLAAAYRSASIVVADHHGSMRDDGFVANRVFDVLASGGLVVSDDVPGLATLFGDSVPTYSTAQELESQIRVLLAEPSLRRKLSQEGRSIVMAGHTFDHRAREWLKLLDNL